ncbi:MULTISPECIES: hypothetical protein [unclassified Actinopolyspora]|uniref:hypothetical protein n=1 Tax=unclassified Actinopolyspora TaxID=2639451 RepID=UPI0013F63AF0|nr:MULTISPECIES: hypothetical protein [unclassified Actinopolyspora]NHD15675.1 hypothetical protein [Actinopolyspora sp. BKK2]NHE75111.1 hypothetical protein [Actinopolyspora sp. BKK1]
MPGLFTNTVLVLFVFVLGFVFLTGDLYVRDRTLGVASMTVLRAPSRGHWWSAKICALGVLSVVYSSLVLVVMLLLGGMQLGWSTTASPTALRGELYYRWAELPIPVFVLVIMLYAALALWAIGAVVMLVSTVVPHPLTPAMAGLVWVLLGGVLAPLGSRTGWTRLDPLYQIFYSSHFGPDHFTLSWMSSFTVILTTLLAAAALGVWRLRHAEL